MQNCELMCSRINAFSKASCYRKRVRPAAILLLCIIAAIAPPVPKSFAAYDANLEGGTIVDLFTYPNGRVLIKMSNQPSSHPVCDPAYFAMDPNEAGFTQEGVDRMYARALTAYAAGIPVTIGYDSQGNCVMGKIRIERVG